MNYKDQLICYCFNAACHLSVFKRDTCLPVSIPLEVLLSRPLYCIECGSELLSPVLVEIKRDIHQLLAEENQCTVSIVDDDIVFHQTVKSLLKKHNILKANFFIDGQLYLRDLEEKIAANSKFSNILFLDLHMPGIDGWEILKDLERIMSSSGQRISVYVLSNTVDPEELQKARVHTYVKAFISKPLTRHFIEKINEELLKILSF
jgi:response regulator RpfG family c-di-GMP phosphodiesterase